MRILALLVLLSAALTVQADLRDRHILVGGSGWVEAVPDLLALNLTLMATGQDVEQLQRAVEKTSQQVLRAAREHAVAEDDVDSSRVSVRPEYEWRDGKQVYRGQTVQRDIQLILRKLDNYGELLQALSRLDIHSMGQPQPGHSQLASLQLDAIDAALANAEAKASRMARTLDLELGEVISAEEQLGASPMAPAPRMLAMESSTAPEIRFGKQRISASVLVRYAIGEQGAPE